MDAPPIEVRGLRFTYPGGETPVVKGLDFEVGHGEIFGFLGPSGAGKSTTQKILIGLLRGYSGDVSVFEQDLRAHRSSYYERVGVSFEIPTLYLKLTAEENLRYFRSLYSGDTDEPAALLERVGLGSDASLRVSQFSKGMKVRLGFVRALLHRPELLFLDEPTAGLDPGNARNVKEIIRAERDRGCTVFLTTHDMTVADQLCDRVAFIVDGELECVDTPRDLKLRHGRRSVRVEFGANGELRSREFELPRLGENREFLEILRGDSVETIHTQETTLEGVFLDVTGRSLT